MKTGNTCRTQRPAAGPVATRWSLVPDQRVENRAALSGHDPERRFPICRKGAFAWITVFFLFGTRLPTPHAADVGQVDFPVTATLPAQEKFNRAVAMLHSFWYEELDEAFSQV